MAEKIEELTVPVEDAGQRLDVFLARNVPAFSRSRLKRLIDTGQVTRNDRTARPRDQVQAGDQIEVRIPPPESSKLAAEQVALTFLYEDEDLIVIDKPAGLSVHPGAGQDSGTLVNALLFHCSDLSGIGGELRPGIVHRLDKDTSGCLVVAKNDKAHLALSRQFAQRKVDKWYLALCRGHFTKRRGEIAGAIGRHPVQRQKMAVIRRGRTARTTYEVQQEIGESTLVLCRLFTGRTHQIRVHLHHLGHPVQGDKVYGRTDPEFPRQMLHAWHLGFSHPRHGGRMCFEAPVPADFLKAGVVDSGFSGARQLNSQERTAPHRGACDLSPL